MLSRTLSSFHFHSPSTTSSAQSSENEDDSDEGQNGSGSSSSKRRSRGLFRAFSRKSRRRKPSPYAGRDGASSERGSSTERESQKAASENVEPSSSLNRSGSNNSSLYGGPAASTSSVNNASTSSVELHEHAPSHPSDNESSSDSDENASQRNDDEEEEESDDPWENDYRDDPEVRANTSANSGTGKRAAEYLESEFPALAVLDMEPVDGPNLVKSPSTSSTSPFGHHHLSAGVSNTSLHDLDEKDSHHHRSPGLRPSRPHSRRLTSQTGSINSVNSKDEYPLVSSRPLHERNRCTITLTHGDPDGFIKGTTPSNANRKPRKKKKTYVVASDLSEESYYAIEWAIGTVLRNGDELLFVTVMETDSKLDPDDTRHYDKTQKIRNQHERQTRVLQLSREATALIERTHLHIRVLCQAIHAKNARHMLVDLIDYFHPTLVIVGSRGLGKLKGIILGSVSHYLIQKSSSPVMVTRRRLKPPQKPRRTYDLQREPRVDSLADAAIDKESHTGVVQSSDEETDGAPSTSAKTAESGASSAATTAANTPTTPASIASPTESTKPTSDTGSTAKAQSTDVQSSHNLKGAVPTGAQESNMHVKESSKPASARRINSEDIVQVRADSGDIEEEDEDDDKTREEGRIDQHHAHDESDDDDELPSTELQSPPVDLDSKGRVVEDAVIVDKVEEAERQVEAASQELEARKGG